MLVAIHAFENIYQGLHGIEEFAVVEVVNEEEANEIATEISYKIMDDYDDIRDQFEQEAEFNGYEPDSEEWDDYINECYINNVGYNLYFLKETTKSLEELNELFYNDSDNFISTYCEE